MQAHTWAQAQDCFVLSLFFETEFLSQDGLELTSIAEDDFVIIDWLVGWFWFWDRVSICSSGCPETCHCLLALGLKVCITSLRMSLNLWCFCLHFLNAEIMGKCYHTQFQKETLFKYFFKVYLFKMSRFFCLHILSVHHVHILCPKRLEEAIRLLWDSSYRWLWAAMFVLD